MFNWLSVVAGLFYVVLGIVVIIYKFFVIYLEPNVAYSLGGLLVTYGIFRMVRAIYKIKEQRDEE
ncbi:C4-dicarboxylate ABC transporter [Kaistella sp. SH11-4b]|nr:MULTISPECIES: C4-dicarboxylate ABC transporter [unclassified Kaistella]MCZ2084758.1 C4-dicarboxylate ABC transporter [Flavobacteriales bacterium]MDP2454886.1 C4-dicarboxylate ABC transporter [Kaistella sp. SH11-4b]MDP2456131.1 C4-dicarboxylate ABC transporter [Kaistella sp. SH40-3]MDP2460556.1 C4-dicarboxylate ABC transporter [Kaistella sp. SH19-2b]